MGIAVTNTPKTKRKIPPLTRAADFGSCLISGDRYILDMGSIEDLTKNFTL